MSLKRHPKFQMHQIRHEIRDPLTALFVLSIINLPIFIEQTNGYSKLYLYGSGACSGWYEWGQYPLSLLFSDICMYWLHRLFHTRLLFSTMHKHHQYEIPLVYIRNFNDGSNIGYAIPTTFSAYAFNLFGWLVDHPSGVTQEAALDISSLWLNHQ